MAELSLMWTASLSFNLALASPRQTAQRRVFSRAAATLML
jgi:hypothetical protein